MFRDQGFILSRHARDIHQQTQIELWVKTSSGIKLLQIHGEKVICFIKQMNLDDAQKIAHENKIDVEFKPLDLQTFGESPVLGCYLNTIKQSQHFVKLLSAADLGVWEGDIRLVDRYLMERFIQGSIEFTGEAHNKNSFHLIRGTKCKSAEFVPELTMVSLDIECSEKGILYSVGLESELDSRVIMIGAPQVHNYSCHIQWVNNEKELLLQLIEWFRQYDPDIIVGWNIIDFDFRLLHKRAHHHQLKLNIGRGNSSSYFRQSSISNQGFISVPGRVVLDGIDTLKTATYHFPSWSLEAVSQQLLGEGKAIHNVHDRMAEINHMFRKDKPQLAHYNLQDCRLVTRIFHHTHLLDFAIQRSRLTGLELDKMGGSVAAFTNLYLPRLHRAGYVAPNLQSENWQASPGGYVMDSKPGLYESVLVLDYKSLYPSLILSFLIDPLGLIKGLRQEIGKAPDQAVLGFCGGQFHRQNHILPELIQQLWQARDLAKRNQDKPLSQAIKIIMNSFYGVLGSSGCRFFDVRLASSITMRGQEVMQKTRTLIEQQGYEVIYGDTDSTFVALGNEHCPQQANIIGRQLAESINQWWKSYLDTEFSLTSHLEIEFETHFSRFLMPTIRGSETGSKKRYAGLIKHADDSDEMVFKGLESVRTDWTELSQTFQRELYQRVFNQQPVESYVRSMVERTLNGEFDAQLVYRKRLRRKLSEYQKNIPPQVRAARKADEINLQLGRQLQYQNKGTIEYVITVEGPAPKEYLNGIIDYDHYIEKQLKPVANAILPFIGLEFDNLIKPQLGLF
ncbi:DNA polymerase II [Vibrio sp. RC27]